MLYSNERTCFIHLVLNVHSALDLFPNQVEMPPSSPPQRVMYSFGGRFPPFGKPYLRGNGAPSTANANFIQNGYHFQENLSLLFFLSPFSVMASREANANTNLISNALKFLLYIYISLGPFQTLKGENHYKNSGVVPATKRILGLTFVSNYHFTVL